MDKKTLADSIRELGEQSKYEEQALMFLEKTGTGIEIAEAVPQTAPLWIAETGGHYAERGAQPIQYAITLKNARGVYTFSFWGSINDAEMVELAKSARSLSPQWYKLSDFFKEKTGKTPPTVEAGWKSTIDKTREIVKPSPYSILACLKDSAGDDFEDFCAMYGYSNDSIRAEKTYRAVLEQERSVRRLFTHEEIEALAEIV